MSTRCWPAVLLLLAASPEVQPYVGRAERSAALCPAGMVWVPAGDFFAGADGAAVGLSDYVPDIVRDPRPRAQRHAAGACVDRHEFPYDGPAIADVTWVQARVACEAQGKRLCSEDEWTRACGGPLGWLFPYGDVQVAGLCHADVADEGSYDAVVPGGAFPRCVSPFGVLDQEGNVSEWVEDARADDSWDRWVLGGTMWPGVYGRGCQARHAHPELAPVSGDDGFRCCRDGATR